MLRQPGKERALVLGSWGLTASDANPPPNLITSLRMGGHDHSHAHASHVIRNGESLHVADACSDNRRTSTTNRYVQLRT